MSADFEEHDRIFQQMPYIFMVGVFAAASAFIAVCAALGVGGTPWWMFYTTAIITAFVAAFCRWLSVRILVEDGVFNSGILRMYPVPLTDIIDVKTGDIDIMRNYSGWGIKKVRFKTYACPGIDTAVSVKAAGRLVITVTTSDPEGLAAVLRSGAAESREAGE